MRNGRDFDESRVIDMYTQLQRRLVVATCGVAKKGFRRDCTQIHVPGIISKAGSDSTGKTNT